MKNTWRRFLSAAMAVIMLFSIVPTSAYAALIDNDPAYNEEILAELKELCGSEEEAQAYYALLQQYGLLDETGNAALDWEITMDGEAVSLDEIRALLDDPATDLDKLVVVDGSPISLGDLKTILEIEDYIEYLRETYYSGHQWTAEQLENLDSLVSQIENQGISLYAAGDTQWPSGVSHEARVSISTPSGTGDAGTFTVTLADAEPGQEVSFTWEAVSGSRPVSDSGTVTLTAGSNGSASKAVSFSFGNRDGIYSTAGLVYYIKADNLENALFSNGKRAMTIKGTASETIAVADMQAFTITGTGTGSDPKWVDFTESQKRALKSGAVDTLQILPTFDSTSTEVGYADIYGEKVAFTKDALSSAMSKLSGQNSLYIYPNKIEITVTYNGTEYLGGTYQWSLDYNKFTYSSDDGSWAYNINRNADNLLDILTYTETKGDTKYTLLSNNAPSGLTLKGYTTSSKYAEYNTYMTNYYDLYLPTFFSSTDNAIEVTAKFTGEKAPTFISASAPAGTYYPGQVVPVTVTFSEPVNAATAKVKFNGASTEYSAAEASGYSNVLTFPYTVQDLDNAGLSISSVTVTDYQSKTLNGYNPGGNAAAGQALSGVVLSTPDKLDAFTGMSATVTDPITNDAKLNVTVNVSSNNKLTTWLPGAINNGTVAIRYGGNDYPLAASGENITGGTLTASIDLPINSGETAITHTAELVVDDALVIGKYASATQNPATYITAADMSVSLAVKNADGSTDYTYADSTNTIYAQDNPKITAGYTLANKTYSFPEVEWSSSDPTVAAIDQNGKITPTGKSGEAYFILTAKNGGVEGKDASVMTDTLNFGAGLTPFLLIPNDALSSVSGDPVTVYWSTNLLDKDANTVFTVTVTRGGTEVYKQENITVTSHTIPGDYLNYDYTAGANNTFSIVVSAEYQGTTYSDTATIGTESKPAVVKLTGLDSYYVLDSAGSVSIGWNIQNFDRFSSSDDLFKLYITKDGADVATVTDPGSGSGGVYNSSYALSLDNVGASKSDPTSYRDVYTVTIQAKNGTDSTWSYDSFMLYVYDADALDIWVGGQSAASVTLSNVQKIASMDQTAILALNRDIGLKEIVSVNYGEYAWTELSDQIKWKSSDNKVATVNYQQGTLYENIENFEYVSYRPTTDFGLSGLSDGTATVTATHSLTGMSESLTVDVETLKDKLYLFQCYPQTTTTLTYTNGAGEKKTVISNESGAAAIYEPTGIKSDVYCTAEYDGNTYLGTFYKDKLKSGEGDWTKLERYPCNNLELRRAAYAYLYLKHPTGNPYDQNLYVYGGVYVNGVYQQQAQFSFDGGQTRVDGNYGKIVDLGSDGKLEITMDQTQWGLEGNTVQPDDEISYVFQVGVGVRYATSDYYPVFTTIDANVNQESFVGSGEAVVNFRKNDSGRAHPFIANQVMQYGGRMESVLTNTGRIGPSTAIPETKLHTIVLWWGEENLTNPDLQLYTENGIPVSDGEGEYTISQEAYPFSPIHVTSYTVELNEESLKGVVEPKHMTGLYLDFYKDGSSLSRREELPFRLTNLIGVEDPAKSGSLLNQIKSMGNAMGVDPNAEKDWNDEFVNISLELMAGDNYVNGDDKIFCMQLAPTTDPTKFLGFIELNVGNMSDDEQVTGVYGSDSDNSGEEDWDYYPGLAEMMLIAGKKSGYDYLASDAMSIMKREKLDNKSFDLGGYLETLIYYDFDKGEWEMQVLSGGFNAGGGLSYDWTQNYMVGFIPFTTTLTIGGVAEISMDAITAAWIDNSGNTGMGNDFLTELRVYLYLRLFAGVGIDYAIIAFKLGIYGQIDLNMQFQWLNRPYLTGDRTPATGATGNITGVATEHLKDPTLDGQYFAINGQIGLEFVFKFLFISYEKILYSRNFSLLNESTNEWDEIQKIWEADKAAYDKMIGDLLGNGSISLQSYGGQQMMSLNLAPTMEDNSYLNDGSLWMDGGWGVFALDPTNGMSALNANSYEYANPVLTDDGQIVAFLGVPAAYQDMDNGSEPVEAMFAVNNGGSYTYPAVIDEDTAGYGDSQLSVAGTGSFTVSAWSRQMVDIQKDAGQVLTADDQMMMMNGTEVFASIYNGTSWATTRITNNSGADMAPVVATNGSRAIVAWRSVTASDGNDITNFDQQDMILYKVYEDGSWSDQTYTLYNGTSGNIKAIVADMLSDGTAAVAYTLDTDKNANTTTDREIVYAVVDKADAEAVRTIHATTDAYLDENPQLTSVTFDGQERFVLGWYTEQSAAKDGASALNGDSGTNSSNTTADIRLLDFDATGSYTQQMPDSISKAAVAYDVAISSNFRFTKNAGTIEDLSILWVERAEQVEENNGTKNEVQNDVLKGVKFYTYGQNSELISFTGAVDVAEMPDYTLIDHFDAYVSNYSANEIKAVILGTEYGANGPETKVSETVGGQTVSYTVPSSTTSMYTATEIYENKIDVPAFLPEYDTVKKGAKTEIWFSVDNKGIDAITSLTIQVGSDTTTLNDLNLLPGGNLPVYADYNVPTPITDPTFTVTATFNGGETKTFTGTVYLNLPDIEITDAAIVEEVDGKRTIQIKLNNRSDADLGTDSGTNVKLSFYSDAACETPVTGLTPIVISDAGDLSMIDDGGYSTQIIFNVAEYINTGKEIPENGIPVYIKAEVIETATGKAQGEPSTQNNFASVTCDNLKTRTGKDVTITSDLAIDDSTTTVTVALQNTRLTQITTGNVIVTLLDKDGKVLEQLQSYNPVSGGADNGLITLAMEQKATQTFTFDRVGASVEVSYSDLIIDEGWANANLTSLTFTGIPGITLASFQETETGTYTASVSTDDLTSTTVIAATEVAGAKVKITGSSGEGSNALSEVATLTPGEVNTISITVTSSDGSATKTYILTVQNNGEPVIDLPGDPTPDGEIGYSTSVTYQGDNATITLTAAAKPENGYAIGYQWYKCSADGSNPVALPGETGTTLTVSANQDVDTYYYKCAVIRKLVDGTEKTYWSSIATVQVTQATGNSVTAANRQVIDHDGAAHQLSAATATKTGSTIYYSTNYVEGSQDTTWSTTPPSFSAVGVHQVWIKATHRNYVDTAVVTTDLLIQGDPTIGEPVVVDGTSVTYGSNGTATITVTASQNPSSATYGIAYQWYECELEGDSKTKLDGETNSTLTITGTTTAGTHYYICEVIRTMEDGSTKSYWSNKASVEIQKASGNAVNVTSLIADYAEGVTHTVPAATADIAGSKILYSTDAGTTWSETRPSFTAVGVHTVWVKASHQNYVDTQIKTCTVLIQGDPTISTPTVEIAYGSSVVYGTNNAATIKVTAVRNPDTANYDLAYQWYECDAQGNNEKLLTGETTDTLVIPGSNDAGTYYYKCKVTRTLTDDTTVDYWSTIATVQIVKATDNAVNVSSIEVLGNGNPHSLSATATKSGSTILYSTDYGTKGDDAAWSTTNPGFTDVGVYQVWLKATNPNYEDTAVVTATVLVQGAPSVSDPVINTALGTDVIYGSDNSATIKVTAVRDPIDATYAMSYQWYECDAQGGNCNLLTGETSDTLTIPSTTAAGIHYYCCKVTGKMADGSDLEVWSSVATVQIVKASDNAVVVSSVEVIFDGQPHSLSAEATKPGSTLLYSTDYGAMGENATWSQDNPGFTAFGVYSVWIKATNPNYEDTAIVTADVVITENDETDFKLETSTVAESFDSYPQEIRALYADAAAMEEALKTEMTELGVSEKNTAVYEIKLLFTLDGGTTWTEATEENFPANGITVTLPYPDGTGRYSHNFKLQHLITNPLNTGKTVGDIEEMDITLTANGIQFTTDCLSPFVLGWERKPVVVPSYATLTFDVNGGTEIQSIRRVVGSNINLSGYTTTRTGYEFTGWYSDAALKNKITSVRLTKNTTVYAGWKKIAPTVTENPFVDVFETDWFFKDVMYVYANNLMNGTGNNVFSPAVTTTRGMIVTILYRLEGEPSTTGLDNPFTDLTQNWYVDSVKWAAANGIVSGYGNGKYGPDDPITREQMATILWRYAKYKGYDVSSGKDVDIKGFADDEKISSYAVDAMKWVIAEGIITGRPGGILDPAGKAQRCEVAAILHRFCLMIEEE